MAAVIPDSGSECRLSVPERNRYFHGKMLDVRHFRLETEYHVGARRLINRLVLGHGVVCGLAVREGDDPHRWEVVVEPGMAIDSWGREIVVDEPTPLTIPRSLRGGDGPGRPGGEDAEAGEGEDEESEGGGGYGAGEPGGYGGREPDPERPGYGRDEGGEEGYGRRGSDAPGGGYGHREDDVPGPRYGRRETDAPGPGYGRREPDRGGEGYEREEPSDEGRDVKLHLVLCYHECAAEPAPVLAGDCRDEEPCQPGVIRERYRLEVRPGCLPPRRPKLLIPDVVSSDGRVDYETLVRAVSERCPCPDEACVPLANLVFRRGRGGRCHVSEIDLAVRPIVYGNDLLFQLILSAVTEGPSYRRDK